MRLPLLLIFLLAVDISDKRNIQILGPDPRYAQGRALMPHVPPVVYVRQTKGAALPEMGSVNCHWHEETRESRPVIVGTCDDDVELVVTGLDLNY